MQGQSNHIAYSTDSNLHHSSYDTRQLSEKEAASAISQDLYEIEGNKKPSRKVFSSEDKQLSEMFDLFDRLPAVASTDCGLRIASVALSLKEHFSLGRHKSSYGRRRSVLLDVGSRQTRFEPKNAKPIDRSCSAPTRPRSEL